MTTQGVIGDRLKHILIDSDDKIITYNYFVSNIDDHVKYKSFGNLYYLA